jgi:hypothetical protein
MSTIPYLSGSILSGIVAAFAAASFFDSPPVSGTAGQFSLQRSQTEGTARSPGSAVIDVNRDRKSDRLPVLSATDGAAPASPSNTTVVRKNVASPAKGANGTPARPKAFEIDDAIPTPKPIPAALADCEPVASPFADPVLGRVIGRCIV